jgi:hypothetical protein
VSKTDQIDDGALQSQIHGRERGIMLFLIKPTVVTWETNEAEAVGPPVRPPEASRHRAACRIVSVH